ncbi:LacI family DNA-binding transcriptional regulator, partial [Candidatus Bipolaricaulota bacterium]|nr:LacI family DNA-binding transcriptional regulator [Candidatus Bipolaricaulota bacterium]
ILADTLDQVAEIAGVSRATVSRVINNSQNVSKSTEEKVQRAIEQSGYKPHAVARSLAKKKTGIIGLVIPEAVSRLFSDPFFAPFIRAVTEECNELGYELMLSLLTTPDEEEKLYPDVISNSFLDGLLIASNPVEDPLIEALIDDGTPFVSVGRHPNEQANYVDVNNYSGAKRATEYLLNLGHERIATITGPLNQAPAVDRLNGYKDALKEANLEVEDDLIYEGDFTEESGSRGIHKLLANFPTAVFAANDLIAIGVLKELKEMNKKVPEDVAIVGFDDIQASSAVEPPLTTISQPIDDLGRVSVRYLKKLIERKQSEEQNDEDPIRKVLDTELIVRSST